jgi:chromate transporter
MGLLSPGPVVIMATFAGYLVFGLAGAIIATICVFLPALLLVALPGPYIRRHENDPRLQGFIKGATAAAAGAIAGAAIVIAGLALAALLQKRVKVTEPMVVAVAAILGLVAL